MQVVDATIDDIAPWLALAREVEPLFGPMPDLRTTLLRKIDRRAAICVRLGDGHGSGEMAGAALLGGTAPQFWIRWLAVRPSSRNQGIGAALVTEALRRFPPPCRVNVDTFRRENVEGRAARRLYRRFGFQPGELTEFQGAPRQRYVLACG
jgi:ribosomal protein S18 acetylase RimI-like enzyme